MANCYRILPLDRQEFNATRFLQDRKGWVLGYPVALISFEFLFLDEAINATHLPFISGRFSATREETFKFTLTGNQSTIWFQAYHVR